MLHRKRHFLAITYEYAQSSPQTLHTLSKNVKENQTCSAVKATFKAPSEATATSITVSRSYEIGGDAPQPTRADSPEYPQDQQNVLESKS